MEAGCKGDASRRCAPVTSPKRNTQKLVVNASSSSTELLDDETILAHSMGITSHALDRFFCCVTVSELGDFPGVVNFASNSPEHSTKC